MPPFQLLIDKSFVYFPLADILDNRLNETSFKIPFVYLFEKKTFEMWQRP